MCGPCGYHGHHGHGGGCCCSSAWGPGFYLGWRFPGREEYVAWLEEYLKALQAEVEAVQKRIAELKEA
ncbi:MAG: DUF5320 domain-containing protein [Chloroflexi bacterium]|nr:DUF5320 domain-containing protein [Chloroflexota bacterium]